MNLFAITLVRHLDHEMSLEVNVLLSKINLNIRRPENYTRRWLKTMMSRKFREVLLVRFSTKSTYFFIFKKKKFFPDVVNKNVIAKIHQEVLKENDLHHDVMIDLMIKAENESFKFIDLSVAPVRCKLVSQLQLKTAIDFFKNKNCLRRCHFDATGSILGKISSDRPEMMLYYLILPLKTNEKNTNHLRFNIAELVSESQTSFTIESFLRHVANDVKMLSSSNFQLIHEVVVDWSWAEINAVIKAFNNISVQNYIDTVFKIISTGDPLRLKSLVVLLECSSHLTHTMKSDVKKHVKDFVQQKLICMLLGQIFNCESWVQACSVIEDLIAVLTSKTKNCRVELAIVRIQNNDVLSADENIDNNEQEAIEFEKRDCKEIYKDSAFFQVVWGCFNNLINIF